MGDGPKINDISPPLLAGQLYNLTWQPSSSFSKISNQKLAHWNVLRQITSAHGHMDVNLIPLQLIQLPHFTTINWTKTTLHGCRDASETEANMPARFHCNRCYLLETNNTLSRARVHVFGWFITKDVITVAL